MQPFNATKFACGLIIGSVLGLSTALGLLWMKLDAVQTKMDAVAASCLNPFPHDKKR